MTWAHKGYAARLSQERWWQPVSFLGIFVCSQSGDHPYKDVEKGDIIPARFASMKHETFQLPKT
jgi:hypothetical protein